MINYYTQNAKVFPPNSDAVIGIPAIAEMVSLYMKFKIQELRIESTAIYGNEDHMIDEGKYFMRYGKNNIIDTGKQINVWKKEGGEWQVYNNMWNSNTPLTTTE